MNSNDTIECAKHPNQFNDSEWLSQYSSIEEYANAIDEAEFPVKDAAVQWASKIITEYMKGRREALEEQSRPSGLLVKLIDGITFYRRDVKAGRRIQEWYADVNGTLSFINNFVVDTWPEQLKEALVAVYKKNNSKEV